MSGKAFLNGQIVPSEQAVISSSDTGFLHGASVFTTMLAHNGKVFRLEQHLCRLLDHAQRINLRHPATKEALTQAVNDLLAAEQVQRAVLRITLSPGPVGAEPQPTTLVTASPLGELPASWYGKGVGAGVCEFRQNPFDPLAGLKTGCYLPRILARQKAAAAGMDESLWFTPDGHLAEGCFSNVFVVIQGKLLTPPLSTPVLDGVTRQVTLELCRELAIPCDDSQPVHACDLAQASEMFLTSSTMLIRPVAHIDRQAFPGQTPGPISQRLMQAMKELLERECPSTS
jgi:branched-chain amino acid aminotransferase